MEIWKATEILLLASLVACRSSPQTIAPRNVAEISPSKGAVSAKLVPAPDSPDVRLGPGEEYVSPQLASGNPQPKYPAELIAKRLPLHIVAVRVTFDERGRLFDIAPSPIADSTHDEYQQAFEASVREAVEHWRCWPASIRKFREGPDSDGDGKPDYRILVAQRLLKTFFDISFSFEIVNGQPVVRSGR